MLYTSYYNDGNWGYGICGDPYCDFPDEDTDLIDGRCYSCHDLWIEEQEDAYQSSFDENEYSFYY